MQPSQFYSDYSRALESYMSKADGMGMDLTLVGRMLIREGALGMHASSMPCSYVDPAVLHMRVWGIISSGGNACAHGGRPRDTTLAPPCIAVA